MLDFRTSQHMLGKNTLLFDDLHGISTRPDKALIEEMNKQLEKDSSYPLPDGYKVQLEKKHALGWMLPQAL